MRHVETRDNLVACWFVSLCNKASRDQSEKGTYRAIVTLVDGTGMLLTEEYWANDRERI